LRPIRQAMNPQNISYGKNQKQWRHAAFNAGLKLKQWSIKRFSHRIIASLFLRFWCPALILVLSHAVIINKEIRRKINKSRNKLRNHEISKWEYNPCKSIILFSLLNHGTKHGMQSPFSAARRSVRIWQPGTNKTTKLTNLPTPGFKKKLLPNSTRFSSLYSPKESWKYIFCYLHSYF
jgi:hypothetical protein